MQSEQAGVSGRTVFPPMSPTTRHRSPPVVLDGSGVFENLMRVKWPGPDLYSLSGNCCGLGRLRGSALRASSVSRSVSYGALLKSMPWMLVL